VKDQLCQPKSWTISLIQPRKLWHKHLARTIYEPDVLEKTTHLEEPPPGERRYVPEAEQRQGRRPEHPILKDDV
jgi:hypothetical protein